MGIFTIRCERCLALTKSKAKKDAGRVITIAQENMSYRVQQAKLNRMPCPKTEEWWLCGECVARMTRWLYNDADMAQPGGGGDEGAGGGDDG